MTAALESLITSYLEDGGCPCRYPRFRTTVRRDTTGAAGGSFTTAEQRDLIKLFESRVPMRDRREAFQGWEAICERCGSAVRYSNGESMDFLVVTRAAGVRDLGANVGNTVYRTGDWIAVGQARAVQLASKAFPAMELDPWLAWMREKRPAD